MDDFESTYREYREANENHIIGNSDFQDEIDKAIKKNIIDNVSNYEIKLLKVASRSRMKGYDTSNWGDDITKKGWR